MIGIGRNKDPGTVPWLDADGNIRRTRSGEDEHTSHGPRQNTVVVRLADYPVMRGTPDRWSTPNTEVCRYLRRPAEDLTVRAYGRYHATDRNWPLEWIVSIGKGCLFRSSFGHIRETDVGIPGRLLCSGIQTSKVTYPVPKGFPPEATVVTCGR